MALGIGAMRVGVFWAELAGDPAQMQRIADTPGVELRVWDGVSPAPDLDALIVEEVPDAVPSATPRLRLLQCESAGIDYLRRHPVWNSDVAIATAAGVHGIPIGEHVFALLLALRRNMAAYGAAQRRHEWAHDLRPREIYSLTMGLIGFGHVGRGTAHLARAHGMRVIATSATAAERRPLAIPGVSPFYDPPAVTAAPIGPDVLLPLAEIDELLAEADVVVVCAALSDRSAGLIGARALASMKRGAYLINIARGKIVDEDALARALRDGGLAGAGLDVTAEEPLAPDSPLWDLPNVVITPHVSGDSEGYVERVVSIFLANLERVQRGEPPLTAVDRTRGY